MAGSGCGSVATPATTEAPAGVAAGGHTEKNALDIDPDQLHLIVRHLWRKRRLLAEEGAWKFHQIAGGRNE